MRGLLVFMAALGAVAAHGATLYRYVNPQGMTVYQETPPPSSARQVQRTPVPRPSSPNRTAATQTPVVLYLAPACPPCRKAQAYLRSRGVPFTTVDVAASAAAAKAMRAQTGVETVPTIRVGTQILVGYVRSVWADALTVAGYRRRPAR
ncbi:MAG: glutaredoxin domain-containing protein [Acidiferrobacter sp.]